MSRIKYAPYLDKIQSPEEAALLIKNRDVLGVSGFTNAGEFPTEVVGIINPSSVILTASIMATSILNESIF